MFITVSSSLNRHFAAMVPAMSCRGHFIGTQLRKKRFYFGGGRSNVRKITMRKTLIALSAAAALTATAASPALSNPRHHHHHHHGWVAPAVGAGVGTVVGVGLYHGWFGASTTAAAGSLATSTAGAATAGGLAGVGTIALIHAASTKCQGLHALFGGSGCVNGQYVGERVAYRR
jgi:hypothetical protein